MDGVGNVLAYNISFGGGGISGAKLAKLFYLFISRIKHEYVFFFSLNDTIK